MAVSFFFGILSADAAIFSGKNGAPFSLDEVMHAVGKADVVILGEIHTDANGHSWQQIFLRELVARNIAFSLSLEEFDRSQQSSLNEFAAGQLDGDALKGMRTFIVPSIRENWNSWYLPKLQIARDARVDIIASNAPLKYSRMARNQGCQNLAELSIGEQDLFNCPVLPVDPDYQMRFFKTMSRVSHKNQSLGLKPLDESQMANMFRAHRVWDATMAHSIIDALDSEIERIVHIVGSFHSDFNGGLLKELRAREPDIVILVISIRKRKSISLLAGDESRADIIVYSQ